MVLGGKEGLGCKIRVEGERLEQVSEFKIIGVRFGQIRYR